MTSGFGAYQRRSGKRVLGLFESGRVARGPSHLFDKPIASGCFLFNPAEISHRRRGLGSRPGRTRDQPADGGVAAVKHRARESRVAATSRLAQTSSHRASRPVRGAARSTKWGWSRSQPSARARSPGRGFVRPAERSSRKSLIALCSVRRSIMLTFCTRPRSGPRSSAATSRFSGVDGPRRRHAHREEPEELLCGDERHDQGTVSRCPAPDERRQACAGAPRPRRGPTRRRPRRGERAVAAAAGATAGEPEPRRRRRGRIPRRLPRAAGRCARRATAGRSCSSVEAAAARPATRSARPSTSASRRRVRSYSRAFSIAPATRLAAWVRKSVSSCVNSRGASA